MPYAFLHRAKHSGGSKRCLYPCVQIRPESPAFDWPDGLRTRRPLARDLNRAALGRFGRSYDAAHNLRMTFTCADVRPVIPAQRLCRCRWRRERKRASKDDGPPLAPRILRDAASRLLRMTLRDAASRLLGRHKTRLRVPRHDLPGLCQISPSKIQRAQGMPGASSAPAALRAKSESTQA